jgi:alkylation response protein AidB-like acyl-CoA dehydrogenase
MIDQKKTVNLANRIALLKEMTQKQFVNRAAKYDENYLFPSENFRDLHKEGFAACTVSEKFGGLGLGNTNGNIRALWQMTTEIAKADMSTARCWEGHNNALMLLDNLGTYSQKEKWFSGVVNNGEIWSVWSGEPLLKVPGQDKKIGTTVTKTSNGYLLNGSKVFCSSASGATWANLLVNSDGSGGARHADGAPECVIMLGCELADPSISFDNSWWKPLGMHGSVSYLVRFDNTLIPFENQIGAAGQFLTDEWQTRWLPQYAATFLGGAEAAFEYTLAHIESQQRQNDPFVQHRVAKMAINIQSAHLWLDHVADLWNKGDIDTAKSTGNVVRYQVEQLVTQTIDHALHVCGARGLIQPSPLERIFRDVSFYTRHDNDDQLLATIGKSVLGQTHDRSFFNS